MQLLVTRAMVWGDVEGGVEGVDLVGQGGCLMDSMEVMVLEEEVRTDNTQNVI